MSNHTPGPWKATGTTVISLGKAIPVRVGVMGTEADAHLTATSLDMLAALIGASCKIMDGEYEKAWRLMDAVIAKAKGETGAQGRSARGWTR